MLSGGSPNISSANKRRVKSVDEFSQLLIRFNELNQAFLQSLQAFRERVEPGISTRVLNAIISPQGASTLPTSSTPLLSLKKTAAKETDKESLNKLNVFLESWNREKTLGYAAIACARFATKWQQEMQVRERINNQLLQLEQGVKNEFQADVRSRQAAIKTARENAVQLSNELQDLSVSFSALKEFEDQLASVYQEVEAEVISFGEQAIAFHKKNQDKEELKRLVQQVPSLDALATVPREGIKFNDLEEMIIRGLKEEWKNGDTFQGEMTSFLRWHGGLPEALTGMLDIYSRQVQVCESVKWNDLKASLQVIDAKVIKEGEIHFNIYHSFREQLIQLINPLVSDEKILSSEEKDQQVNFITSAFDEVIAKVSSKTLRMQKTLNEIEALKNSAPTELKQVMLGDDVRKAIEKMRSLHDAYEFRVEFLIRIPDWARYYSDQHVILLLERLRRIVTKEDYAAICKQAGVSIDLSLEALIERHKHKIDKDEFDQFMSSSYFHASDTFLTLNNMRGEFCKTADKIDFIAAFCADGGGEAARKVLQVGMEFLNGACKRYHAQLRNFNFIYNEAKKLIGSGQAYKGFERAAQLFQKSQAKKSEAEKYNAAKVNQVLEDQQTVAVIKTAELKRKWLSQPEWDKQITDALYANSKPNERLGSLQEVVTGIGNIFQGFDALHFPVIEVAGSYSYRELAAQFNELIKLSQDIYSATDDLLENDASMLKAFMHDFEVQTSDKVAVQRKSLLGEFQGACADMGNDIEVAVKRYEKVERKHAEVSVSSSVLPRFEAQIRAFNELQTKYKKRVGLVSGHIQTVHDPLLNLNELDKNAGLSLAKIQTEWLYVHVLPFLVGDYDEQFKPEEKKRKQYIKEAVEWAEVFKPNLAILSNMKALWDRVCLADTTSKVKLHNEKVADFSLALENIHLDSIDSIAAANRIITLIQGLKNNILNLLTKQLDQENLYSREMAKCIIESELRKDWGIWIEVSVLDYPQSRWLKEKKESAGRLLYELEREGKKLDSMLHVQGHFNNRLFKFQNDNNCVRNGQRSLERFVCEMSLYAMGLKSHHFKSSNFINILKQEFNGKVTQALKPIMVIKKQATTAEDALKASYQSISNDVERLSEEAKQLQQALNSIVSDLDVNAYIDDRAANKNSEKRMSVKVSQQLSAIKNRTMLSESKDEVLVNTVNLGMSETFNTKIIEAIAADQSPIGLLNEEKDKLAQDKINIEQKVEELKALQERKINNAATIAFLANERKKLQVLQQDGFDILYKQAKLLFSKEAGVASVDGLGDQKVKFVARSAERLEEINRSLQAIRPKNLVMIKQSESMADKKNAHDLQLKQLSVMHNQVCQLLKTISDELKEIWEADLNKFDLMKYGTFGYMKTVPQVRILSDEVKTNFESIVEADLQDFVIFPVSKENNYAKLRALSYQILNMVNVMLKADDFFGTYYQSIVDPFVKSWDKQEHVLSDIYRSEMQKVTDLYSWLISASENRKLYRKSIKHLSIEIIVGNIDNICHLIAPFTNDYALLTKRSAEIGVLDEAIAKMETEQSIIDKALRLQPELINQSERIKAQIVELALLEPRITQQIAKIEQFKLDKLSFDKIKRMFFAKEEPVKLFEDLEAVFVARKARLCDASFLYAYALGEEKPLNVIFGFYSDALEQALTTVKTKHIAIVTSLQKQLQDINQSGDDELSKLNKLHTLIKEEYEKVSAMRGGKPSMFGDGSKLAGILKVQLERLNQLLAFDLNLVRRLGLGLGHQ